jgi:hypothetical protein
MNNHANYYFLSGFFICYGRDSSLWYFSYRNLLIFTKVQCGLKPLS